MFLSWPILVFFAFSSICGQAAEANWPAPAYIAGVVLMWGVFRQHFASKRRQKEFIAAAIGLALVLNLLLHVHLVRPIIPYPPEKDTMRQFHGWRQLGERIDSFIKEHPHNEGYFLVSDRGTTVAEAVFYSDHQLVGLNLLRPERYAFLPDLSQLKGKNALLLIQGSSESKQQAYRPDFDGLSKIGVQQLKYRGEVTKTLHIILAEGYRGN
jgi:hypothetical protein